MEYLYIAIGRIFIFLCHGAIIVNYVWVSYIFVFVMESFCLRAEMLGLDVELGLPKQREFGAWMMELES